MSNFTTEWLTKTLNKPGSENFILPGSSLPTTATQRPAAPTEPANTADTPSAPGKRHSAVLWASEREFARAVAAERDIRATLQAEYRLMHHIANENSHREPGVLAGVPDWHWPIRSGGDGSYIGMWIEIKIGRNQLSPMQVAVMNLLRAEGHYCAVVWDSLEQVFDLCDAYLQGEI